MPHSLGDDDTELSLLMDALEHRARQVNTCTVGVIVSYDVDSNTALVRPGVQRPMVTADAAPIAERLSDIPCVVVTVRGSGFVSHIPPKAGDGVLVLFTQWSISEWRRQGGTHVDPGDQRHHSIGSAVCIPGLFPSTQPIEGLSATEALFGNPAKSRVVVAETGVHIGFHGHTGKKAARKGDAVKVTIPDGTVFAGTVGGVAASFTVTPGMELVGEITEGSSDVDLT